MIKWLKNLLNLNGFSKGGFTGRGHVSAMADRDYGREFILPTDCRLPVIPDPEYAVSGFKAGGYVGSPPPDDGLVLAVLSPGTKDAI